MKEERRKKEEREKRKEKRERKIIFLWPWKGEVLLLLKR
jgi:hypothetical protein